MKNDHTEAVLLSNATKRRHDEAMFVGMLSSGLTSIEGQILDG